MAYSYIREYNLIIIQDKKEGMDYIIEWLCSYRIDSLGYQNICQETTKIIKKQERGLVSIGFRNEKYSL